jgi:hypothetical protein
MAFKISSEEKKALEVKRFGELFGELEAALQMHGYEEVAEKIQEGLQAIDLPNAPLFAKAMKNIKVAKQILNKFYSRYGEDVDEVEEG